METTEDVATGAPPNFKDPRTIHDRVLVIGEEKFYVHSGLLGFWSEYFYALFNSNFKEKDQDEIELKDVEAEDFHDFLKALIPGNHSVITVNNYLNVMDSARRFLAPTVLAMCEQFTIANFVTLDKFDLLKMAFEYNWNELKDIKKRVACTTRTTGTNCAKPICTNEEFPNCKTYGANCNYCGNPINNVFLNKSSFLFENKEKLAELPAEAHLFILETLLKK